MSTPCIQYGYSDGSNNTARRTSITYPDGTVLELRYGSPGSADDAFNRVQRLQSDTSMGVDYSFLGVDRTVICGYFCEPSIELTYFTPGGSGDAGDQYTGLDRFGRVIDQRWRKTSDDTDRKRIQYGFDRASNRQWRQNVKAGPTGKQDEYYTYDGLYQIKTLQRGALTGTPPTGIGGTPTWEEDWNYDPLGNWNQPSGTGYLTKVTGTTALNQNRTHNVANEITGISQTTGPAWPTPVQNAVGNITSTPQPLSLTNSFDLKWDAWNRLVEVSVTGGGFIARYAYDGANRRISKLTGKEFRHYYYSDQWQILEERLLNNLYADRRFIWGTRYIDDLICRDRWKERLYVLHDYFNVTAVVDVTGNVQERYGYDGFGGVRYMADDFSALSSSAFDWETLFSAYRYDGETGLYQVRYRYLHSKLGRWPSRDPAGYEAGLNLMAYGLNNTLNLVDPNGLDCGYFLLGTKDVVVDKATGEAAPGFFVTFKENKPGCCCTGGSLLLVQAARRLGTTLIDASDDQWRKNRTTKGGTPIPPYPGSGGGTIEDAPDWGKGNDYTWQGEACILCRVKSLPDSVLCCITYSWVTKKGVSSFSVPKGNKRKDGSYSATCQPATELWNTAVEGWKKAGGTIQK